jgi:hypothetical protein
MLPKTMIVQAAGGMHNHGLYFLAPDNPSENLTGS